MVGVVMLPLSQTLESYTRIVVFAAVALARATALNNDPQTMGLRPRNS